MSALAGKVIVITGAAAGIGRGIARAATAEGMKLVLADRDGASLDVVTAALAAAGASVVGVATDVADADAVDQLAEAAWARFGAIDMIVNNAGIEIGGNSWELSIADWRRVIDVNLMGLVNGIRAFVPRLIDQGTLSNFVIVTSLGALGSIGGQAPYMASKHGAQALAESLFLELSKAAPFIRVSTVLPGAVDTAIWKNALGSTDDRRRRVLTAVTAEQGIDPDEAGRMILASAARGEYWISTDPALMLQTARLRADFFGELKQPSWQFEP